jgi:uncharacterized protein YndB with AHSA1/START domain
MPVTNVDKNPDTLTMTLTAEIDAPVERAWELWSDPRQLERWWGPPTYPATFVEYDLSPGANATYHMTSPEGERFHGWWRVLEVDAPIRLVVEDGFGASASDPMPDMPVSTMQVALRQLDDQRTHMTIETTFPSIEAMEKIIEMGMAEGMTEAVNQIDDLVRAGSTAR